MVQAINSGMGVSRQIDLHASTGSAPAAQVDYSQGYPKGDGSFAGSAWGTQPQKELDLNLSMMANDVYGSDAVAETGTQSEADLAAAGWHRLRAEGDHMVDVHNRSIPIHPDLLNPPDTGFDAAIYQNDQGQYVVAFRGTDDKWRLYDDNGQFLGPGTDIRANGGQGMGMSIEQYEQAMKVAKVAVDTFGKGNVVFTGHSLGGGLASAAMLKAGVPGVTFNAAGLSDNTLRDLGFVSPNDARQTLAHSGQIRRYNVAGEPLTAAQQYPGVGALPEAVGYELRVAPPPGCTGLAELHGGGGNGQAYVESLRQGQPVYHPAEPAFLLASNMEDTLESGLKGLISVGVNAYEAGYGAGKAVGQTGQEIAGIVRNDLGQGNIVQAGVKMAGSVADGALDAGASIAKEGADAAGDLLMESSTLAGNWMRNAARGSMLQAPVNMLAKGVETIGYGVNALVDSAGALAATGMDKLGNVIQWGSEKMADGIQAGKQMLMDGAAWLGNKTVEGLQWAGNKVAEGVEWAGNKVIEGARWASEKAAEGAQWVGDRFSDLGNWFNRVNPVGR